MPAMTDKTMKQATDTFVDVILWNRATGLRDVHQFDGTDAAIKAGRLIETTRAAIRAGEGPYTQCTLEMKSLTTWEIR